MKDILFKGAGVALVTPMNADGSVNYEKIYELADWQIRSGTAAIISCGTTGESSTLTDEEHIAVIKAAVEAAGGRVPVIAGTGSNDTEYSILLSKEAEAAGADALLQVTPYYNKASQRGLIAHFTKIADSVKIPVILYNVPSRTGVNISPDTYYELSKVANIVAAKEANGDITSILRTMNLCGDNLHIYSGNDDQITAVTALGGLGVISVLSNILPKETHEMVMLAIDGKIKESAALQKKYLDLVDSLFCDINPIPVKDAMNMMGLSVGPLRMPLVSMDDAHTKRVLKSLQNVNLL